VDSSIKKQMKRINFVCPEETIFLKDFNKCESCEDKDICINYIYEKEFINKTFEEARIEKSPQASSREKEVIEKDDLTI